MADGHAPRLRLAVTSVVLPSRFFTWHVQRCAYDRLSERASLESLIQASTVYFFEGGSAGRPVSF